MLQLSGWLWPLPHPRLRSLVIWWRKKIQEGRLIVGTARSQFQDCFSLDTDFRDKPDIMLPLLLLKKWASVIYSEGLDSNCESPSDWQPQVNFTKVVESHRNSQIYGTGLVVWAVSLFGKIKSEDLPQKSLPCNLLPYRCDTITKLYVGLLTTYGCI